MRLPLWPKDTIAWRFGLTIVASLLGTCGLIGLFFVFGGVWAQPPMDASARLEGVAAIIRMVEMAPPLQRPVMAEAARTAIYRVDWHAAASAAAHWLDANDAAQNSAITSDDLMLFSHTLHRTVLAFSPDDAATLSPDFPLRLDSYPGAYFFAVKLADNSWIVFTGFKRYWGISQLERLAIWAVFLALSFTVVSAIAARQLSRPIRHFAEAVRRSGTHRHAPPIAAEGPQELREVITAYNDMQVQIQEFVAYRTSMLAAISHDLRTPLTRMRLRGEFVVDSTQQARLFRDVDEMQAMIDGALAFFRGDSDEEASRPFDIADILQSIADDYADQGIDIAYAGPDHLVYVGRPLALKRALTNLIENAVKYGTPPRIELAHEIKGISVMIRDHGPGISAEALDKVFRPFYRLDMSRNRTTGGVGLGLTAAQSIVRGHGGDIVLRNHPEGGLEAVVGLPLAGQ